MLGRYMDEFSNLWKQLIFMKHIEPRTSSNVITIHFFLDHSFFGSEWQKRWCILNNLIFYYFGTEKGLYETSYRNIIDSVVTSHSMYHVEFSLQINNRRGQLISANIMCSWCPT